MIPTVQNIEVYNQRYLHPLEHSLYFTSNSTQHVRGTIAIW